MVPYGLPWLWPGFLIPVFLHPRTFPVPPSVLCPHSLNFLTSQTPLSTLLSPYPHPFPPPSFPSPPRSVIDPLLKSKWSSFSDTSSGSLGNPSGGWFLSRSTGLTPSFHKGLHTRGRGWRGVVGVVLVVLSSDPLRLLYSVKVSVCGLNALTITTVPFKISSWRKMYFSRSISINTKFK